jgi:hypothetical protein
MADDAAEGVIKRGAEEVGEYRYVGGEGAAEGEAGRYKNMGGAGI